MDTVLKIDDLNVNFLIHNQEYPAIENLSLHIASNEVIGIVGESGSGKSLTAKTILGILPKNTRTSYKEISYKGKDIAYDEPDAIRKIRGGEISMIFQDPLSSLNPVLKIGKQVEEVLILHTQLKAKERLQMIVDLFKQIGFENPMRIYHSYPYELSGGMRQRIVISMAIITNPGLIIADEPTTALDATIQKQILDILNRLTRQKGNALMLISHDWGVISSMTDRVYVMYAGRIVETGPTHEVIENPQHNYTKGLLSAIPSLMNKGKKLYSIPFRVPAIEERQLGRWPYIQTTPANQAEVAAMFPEVRELIK